MRPTTRTVRAHAEYVDGSTVRYTYPCGHFRNEVLLNGAPGNRGKQPMEPVMVKKLAKYWSQGVNVPPCPTCARRKELA